jgi:hypothetical protein
LRDHLRQDFPVPVLLDCGAIGGTWYTAHWAIALRNADGRVTLGAMNGLGESNPTEEDFLHAWHCSFLPAGLNHCGVYAHR